MLFSAGEHFPDREGKGWKGGWANFQQVGGDPVGKTLKKTSFLYFTYLPFQQLQEQQEILNRRWQGHASWFVLGQLGYNQQLLSWLKMMPNQWASSMDIRWCPSEFYEKYTLSSWKCVILSFICFIFFAMHHLCYLFDTQHFLGFPRRDRFMDSTRLNCLKSPSSMILKMVLYSRKSM